MFPVPTFAADAVPAFPGAEGAGALTPGGRGGEVYLVTTLDDDGPGSLRDAVSKPNRIIVFRVGGTIRLKSRLSIRASNLTLAGQTAPGGGICIADYAVDIRASDLVLRHLRFRLGDVTRQETDSLTLWHGVRRVIIDHCSVSWSVDEGLSLAGDVQDVTVQWCIIAEALKESVHKKGEHGYGSLSRASGKVTWHHNLWAHNDARNPRLGDNYGKDPRPTFDLRNNVIYDYGSTATGLTQGVFAANYVGNYIRPGPSSRAKVPIKTSASKSDMRFFVDANLFEADESLTGEAMFDELEKDGKRYITLVDKPFEMPPVTTSTAKEAFAEVMKDVGATLPKRDSADTRVIEQVQNREGKMINSPTDVGGWPELAAGEAPADSDRDGMPDTWETSHSLNPNDPADSATDADNDGYTNIEEYLNHTAPTGPR